jgi:lipoprotein-anchoring transpeptidase ErfK/SrfK
MRRTTFGATFLATLTLIAACSSGGAAPRITKTVTAPGQTSSVATTATSTAPTSAPATSASPTPAATVVHVTSLESDGATYGVGMPIVLYFSPAPTDSSAFTNAVQVTFDGRPANGAWFWEQPTADEVSSHIVEAHYRLPSYWRAASKVHVSVPIGGLSAGKNLVYSGKLTSLDFSIGDKHVSTVNGRAEKMRVYSNNKLVKTIPVSLGEAAHPTYSGVKLVMQKGENAPGSDKLRPDGTVLMSGPGYTDFPVAWSVRVTRSGEYVHAAPWNSLIGQQSTSHGCTNLSTANAKWFYNFAQIGDVVTYTNTGGDPMPVWDGFGDWNVPWPLWSQGGLLLNH